MLLFLQFMALFTFSREVVSQKWESPHRDKVFVKKGSIEALTLVSRGDGRLLKKLDSNARYVKWLGNEEFVAIFGDSNGEPWNFKNHRTELYNLRSGKIVKFGSEPYCGGGLIVDHFNSLTFDCRLQEQPTGSRRIDFRTFDRSKLLNGELKEVQSDSTIVLKQIRKTRSNVLSHKYYGYLFQFKSIGDARVCSFEGLSSGMISNYNDEFANYIDEGYFHCEVILRKDFVGLPNLVLKNAEGNKVASIELASQALIDSVSFGTPKPIRLSDINKGKVLPVGKDGLLADYFLRKKSQKKISDSLFYLVSFMVDYSLPVKFASLRSLPLRVDYSRWGVTWRGLVMRIPIDADFKAFKAVRFDGVNETFVDPIEVSESFVEIPLDHLDRSTYYLVKDDYKLGSQLPR